MTKPGGPPASAGGEVLEIDAMDLAEWEQDQRTPQASVANLAALVKQSVQPSEPVEPPGPRKAPLLARARTAGPASPRPPRASDAARVSAPPTRAVRSDKVTPVVSIATTRDVPAPPMVPAARTSTSAAAARTSASASTARTSASASAARTSASAATAGTSASAAGTSASAARTGASAATAGTSAPRVKAGPRLGSSAERAPDALPSSSRPLNAIRAGVARPGSVMDEARSASLADAAAASGPQPALDDLGHRALRRPPPDALPPDALLPDARVPDARVPDARVPDALVPDAGVRDARVPDARVPDAIDAASVVLPLSAAVEPAPRPYPLAAPAAPPLREHRDRDAAGTRGLPSSSRRRWLWIGGAAGCVTVAIALVLASGRQADVVETPAPGEDHAQASAVAARAALATPVAPVSAPSELPTAPATSAGGSPPAPVPTIAATPGVAATPRVAAIRSGPGPAKKLGGKKVVVEYGGQPDEAAMPVLTAHTTTEDPAIGRARRAYLRGNQQLFAGDTQGAIGAYRQALSLYAGYVGGYRGLGLAYTQLGDRPKALEAFRIYVAVVPGAKDVALIKKRIARLSEK